MEEEILKEFSLTNNEIKIFLILVKNNIMTATQIAKETGLNRPYIYYALERLLEKGFISELIKENKRFYNNINLDELAVFQETKVDILKDYINNLKKLESVSEKNEVEIIKGENVIRNILKKCLKVVKPNEEMLYVGIDEEIMESVEPLYLKKVLNHFNANSISERLIIKKGGKKLKFAKTARYREIDEDYIRNTAKIIFQDTVIELLYGNPVYAIIIKNKKLANSAKKQYEIMWEFAS